MYASYISMNFNFNIRRWNIDIDYYWNSFFSWETNYVSDDFYFVIEEVEEKWSNDLRQRLFYFAFLWCMSLWLVFFSNMNKKWNRIMKCKYRL